MNSEEKQGLKDSIIEILLIMKVCITSFWFWVPVLFSVYMLLQLYLMAISPFLLFIGPAAIIFCAIILDKKRTKAERNVEKVNVVLASSPFFTPPIKAKGKVRIAQLIEEYEKTWKTEKENEKFNSEH